MGLYILLILIYAVILPETFGANILVVFPHVSYNHFEATSKLVTALEQGGHNVTLVSPYKMKEVATKNITEISIPEIVEPIKRKKAGFVENNPEPSSYWSKLKYAEELGFEYASQILYNQNVTKLINSNTVFDLALIEDVSADALAIFSYIFKCHFAVLLSEPLSIFYDNYFVDTTHWLKLNEIRNVHHYIFKELYREWIIFPEQNKIIQNIFPGAPDIRELLYNTSLVFSPSYPTLGNLIPMYSNVKQIGGFHIDNRKPLPRNIENFLNDRKEGVIVISDEIQGTTFDFFLNNNEKVIDSILWNSNLFGGDIFGHPNIKLFIGNGDIYETAYAIQNKVPVLSVLYNRWFQQFLMGYLMEKKIVVEIPINKLDLESLQNAFSELLINNTRFQENGKLASKIIHTKQISLPIDEAVFWIEYIIKFHGATHLRPYDLSYQLNKHLIYTIIILAIIDILLFLFFYWIIKKFLNLIFVPEKVSSTVRKILRRKSKISTNYIQLEKNNILKI